MTPIRRAVDAVRRRQPFASRASLEATAADLRAELQQVREELAASLAEVAAARHDVDRAVELASSASQRVDDEARAAWNELAASGRVWASRLLDVEARLSAVPTQRSAVSVDLPGGSVGSSSDRADQAPG